MNRYRCISIFTAIAVICAAWTSVHAEERRFGVCGDTTVCENYAVSYLTFSVKPGWSIGAGSEQCRMNIIGVNILVGRAAKLRGIEASIGGNVQCVDAAGIQAAGIGNIVAGPMAGIQAAGIGNVVGGQSRGLQIAGFGNVAAGHHSGAQVSAFGNVAAEGGRGLQVAAFGNVVDGDNIGAQISAFGNVVSKHMRGAQIAIFGNVAAEGATGIQTAMFGNVSVESGHALQVAMFGNVAADGARAVQFANFGNVHVGAPARLQVAMFGNVAGDLRGLQVGVMNRVVDTSEAIGDLVGKDTESVDTGTMSGAQIGIYNRADVAKGLQLGIVNRAKQHSGVPVGVVSIVDNVPFRWGLEASETGIVTAEMRSGTQTFRSFLVIGASPIEDPFVFSTGFGFGPRMYLESVPAFFDFNLMSHRLVEDFDWGSPHMVNSARVRLGWRIGPSVAVTAAASLNLLVSERNDGSHLVPTTLRAWESGDWHYRVWPGVSIGVEF